MSRVGIDLLVRLMNRAFSGGGEHSLLANIATVEDESWSKPPQGGKRSIRDITAHVGMFKFVYANHAFRGADIGYEDSPAKPPAERLATRDAAVVWLHEAHRYLIDAIEELEDDSELEVNRKAHWNKQVPTYHLTVNMLEHDLYHAGEINRTRALLQDDDLWYGES